MRDLLFVAHALAFAALATGLRTWLYRNRSPLAATRAVQDGERYQRLIGELADLERRKESNQVSSAEYEARRAELVREATRLRSR